MPLLEELRIFDTNGMIGITEPAFIVVELSRVRDNDPERIRQIVQCKPKSY